MQTKEGIPSEEVTPSDDVAPSEEAVPSDLHRDISDGLSAKR